MKRVESRNNPLFKQAIKIIKTKKNDGTLFAVEGKKLIFEAISSGAIPKMFFKTPDTALEFAELADVCIEIPSSLIKELSTVQNPAEIICIFQCPQNISLDQVLQNGKMLVVLDRIQDPGNLGTIIRTSEAMGADAVLLLKGSCNHFNNKAIRAAMGSSFRLPVFGDLSLNDLIESLHTNSYKTLCTDMSGQPIFGFNFPSKCAIFLGQEGQGISEEVKQECSFTLAIPMQGQVESLNVATSAAICLYEWARKP